MNSRKLMPAVITVGLFILVVVTATAVTYGAPGGRRSSNGVIYVISQGLYFDTFVAVDPLPNQGHFQRLYPGDPSMTLYGPGDPGYLGGRWWVDTNGNDVRDEEDHFFLCPLFGPGRPIP